MKSDAMLRRLREIAAKVPPWSVPAIRDDSDVDPAMNSDQNAYARNPYARITDSTDTDGASNDSPEIVYTSSSERFTAPVTSIAIPDSLDVAHPTDIELESESKIESQSEVESSDDGNDDRGDSADSAAENVSSDEETKPAEPEFELEPDSELDPELDPEPIQAVVRFEVNDDGDLVKPGDDTLAASDGAEIQVVEEERDVFEALDLAWQVVLAEMESDIDVPTIVTVLEEESLSDREIDQVRQTVAKLRAGFAAVARASLDSVR